MAAAEILRPRVRLGLLMADVFQSKKCTLPCRRELPLLSREVLQTKQDYTMGGPTIGQAKAGVR